MNIMRIFIFQDVILLLRGCLIVNMKKITMIIFFYVPNVHLSVARFLKKLLNQNLENLFQSVC